QAEDGIRDLIVTGVQTCALPISTKLKNAAHTTAWSGVSTRVETTVAIELAASWKPLMKSKTTATKMMKTTAVNTEGRAIGSRHRSEERRVGKECRSRWAW